MKEGGLCQKGEENDRCDLPLFCAIAVNILRSFFVALFFLPCHERRPFFPFTFRPTEFYFPSDDGNERRLDGRQFRIRWAVTALPGRH